MFHSILRVCGHRFLAQVLVGRSRCDLTVWWTLPGDPQPCDASSEPLPVGENIGGTGQATSPKGPDHSFSLLLIG